MSKKVLLVDDDLNILEGAGERLQSYGMEVRREATSAGCYEALGEAVPDLVLLNIQLPDGNGLDILKDLLEQHPALQVLMISSVRGVEREALRRGALGVLIRPFSAEDLKANVFRALGERGR